MARHCFLILKYDACLTLCGKCGGLNFNAVHIVLLLYNPNWQRFLYIFYNACRNDHYQITLFLFAFLAPSVFSCKETLVHVKIDHFLRL